MTVVAGAVLAAGAGSRMGVPKGELVVDGERLVDRAVQVLTAAGCAPVVAVVRAGVVVPAAHVVENPDPARGLRSSLALAARACADTDAVAVLLADLPGVGVDAVRAVVSAWRPGRVVVPRYPDGRGHPIVMSPQLWTQALALAGPDEGARRLLRDHPDLVDVVDVAGSATDLDTPDDVEAWTRAR